ncbi:hypothetical protein NDU88_003095, partial [Pleurodeles waltl]
LLSSLDCLSRDPRIDLGVLFYLLRKHLLVLQVKRASALTCCNLYGLLTTPTARPSRSLVRGLAFQNSFI